MGESDIDNWTPIAEAVEITGKSDRTLRRWVSRHKLPSKKIKGRLYVDLTSLDLPSDKVDYDKLDNDKVGKSDIDNDRTDYDSDQIKLAKLQTENERLNSEVDFLRQALAAALSKIPVIEASTTPAQSPTPRWWEFWKR